MSVHYITATILTALLLTCIATADDTPESAASDAPPVELGAVDWNQGIEDALRQSQSTGRPVFVLFQEVPGCATCRNFGNGPLSHPLLVEAIEDLFIPAVVYNNKPMHESLLKRFEEPSWNNPVVRFLGADGADLIPRKDGVYDTHGIATRMIDALRAADRRVPAYLDILAADTAPPASLSIATFQMHCFWEGEGRLGDLHGVIHTTAGFFGDNEVVQVRYNAAELDRNELFRLATSLNCADRIFLPAQTDTLTDDSPYEVHVVTALPSRAKPADQKHAMNAHPHRYLPLTPMQATKVNAALWHGRRPDEYLSPRQLDLLNNHIIPALKMNPDALQDLHPPLNHDDLAQYETKLRDRLESLP